MGCERGCDEDWPWKGESESESVGRGDDMKEKGKVGYAERRTERLRKAVRGGGDKESKTGRK